MPESKRRATGTTPAKRPLTHFLCLPLTSTSSQAALESNIEIFRRDVCYEHDGLPGLVHPKAVRPVGTLHLTLGVMSLKRDDLERATFLLQTLDLEGILRESFVTSNGELTDPTQPPTKQDKPLPLTATLKGLESMHDPKNTSILYVAPQDSLHRLMNFCLEVQKAFREAGSLLPDDRPLKLHATIVNTIYAKRSVARGQVSSEPKTQVDASGVVRPIRPVANSGEGSGHGPNANAPLKINALEILDRFKHFVWASDLVLEKIAICEMGAKSIKDAVGLIVDEQYTIIASAALPTP
ncbi:hypothetical protein LTR95_012040 [Oleoguttula sp. CCFEE 5521]